MNVQVPNEVVVETYTKKKNGAINILLLLTPGVKTGSFLQRILNIQSLLEK